MTSYRPGSFTKNFGWEQTSPGLRRLHLVIKRGFGDQLVPVERATFRRQSLIRDAERQLIPINFFLANAVDAGTNFVAVDELVRLALTELHTVQFDKLALFALHLARVGHRPTNTGHPHAARYLGDFVRDELWQDGAWRTARLAEPIVEGYLNRHVTAEGDDTVRKCTTNYRGILRIAGMLSWRTPDIELSTGEWGESALFLAFDRLSIEASPLLPPTRSDLMGLVDSEQLHKLLGVSKDLGKEMAERAADKYIAVGGHRRLLSGP